MVIDVGMNRDESGKLCGDVDYADVQPIASAITPVPGGVGPMTIAMLLDNTLRAALALRFPELQLRVRDRPRPQRRGPFGAIGAENCAVRGN